MKFKSSHTAKKVGMAFYALAVLCLVIGIYDVIVKEQDWLLNFIIMIFCAVIWIVCGIMVLKEARKQKEAESKKVKINAFNYAKTSKKK